LWVNLRIADADLGRVVFQASPHALATRKRPPDFHRALDVLHGLIEQAKAELENRRLREELDAAHRLLDHLQTELARLRHELHARLPDVPEETTPPAAGDGARQTVERMLAYVHEHYQKPMSLGQLAQALGRNASRLSTVFSHTTGVPFHAYLDELRLAKAKQLLRDAGRSIVQVACETGYASDDWFRHAFKAHTGLSPGAWRRLRS
jgi:AraC-like DNA-binding protein